ncbi:uncharacterized protein N7515_005196 [Penicillium bovifimosum]|uniref:Protein kinase domain-containing protein n=1 Tax=Penicillium bovifimosum TaxID=126998 RepID=A0A9W9GSJ0_9EURO|nr:uncharacterized protein N7515_005196 [Penicillium bovifimosum]KAJ5129157.1 hypothetical protein N7515_005196 [Penicillium bovifimosum]
MDITYHHKSQHGVRLTEVTLTAPVGDITSVLRSFSTADNSSRDYKLRSKQLGERPKQVEERQKQVEDEIRREKERREQAEDEARRENRVGNKPKSSSDPLLLWKPWNICSTQLSEIYRSVSGYLQLTPGGTPHLFTSLDELEGFGREFSETPISSERDLEAYERFAVEKHVRDIISELCKIPAARDEFGLGDGIQFRKNHTNSLNENEAIEADASQPPSVHRPRPDQFCIHRIDGNTNTLLTTVEYKPPHKLPVATLRMGLRPMDLWKEMVGSNKVLTKQEEKLKDKAERLVCSALVQEYHVMIQEGLEYSYVTNGIARVLLRVPCDDPGTLYYFLCDPNSELNPEVEYTSQLRKTSVARTLCLCLMAFRSAARGQEWRNSTRLDLPIWKTSSDHTRSQIPKLGLRQTLLHPESTNPVYPSPESGLSYLPSSPPGSPAAAARRVPTRSQAGRAPSGVLPRPSQSPNSSGSDSNQATSRKRGLIHVTSSPSTQRAGRQRDKGSNQGDQARHHNAQFCTQRCLLGLQSGGILDDCCPNVMLHRRTKDDLRHPIASGDLLGLFKAQLDENIDRCTPLGGCGGYGAPFKLTCVEYGYTVIGKGTTSGLWKEVSGEAQVYHILRKVQGLAVPVFLGTIDLAKIYFLHGAGEIRHMLVMGWGGESTTSMELAPWLRHEIRKTNREIKALGIIHDDLSRDNILWNKELGRALIIDFHRSTLKCRPTLQRSVKRRLFPEAEDPKRLRVT